MSDIKPIVPEEMVRDIVKRCFNEPADDLKLIEGGSVAQTFMFAIIGHQYVIRFDTNKMDANYEKEEFIARNFGSAQIPIPDIIQVGYVQDLCYCISEKVVGQRLDQLPAEEIQLALPSVIATLDAIHGTNISGQSGYGIFNDYGQGFFPSWTDYLCFVGEEERPGGFFDKWHVLFESSFLERDIFERIYNHMVSLLQYCQKERYLVQGNYGFGNLLVSRGQVTAVLDWIDAKYGDFLYDVAWLDFWDPKRGYRDLFRAHDVDQNIDIPSYENRLVCYQCYLSLDALRFFAKSNNATAYQWTKERIRSLMHD